MILGILAGFFLLLPVFVTVGVHMGIEHQKVMYLFTGTTPPGIVINPGAGGTGGGWQPRVIQTTQFCNQFASFIPYPGRYLYNPNPWGDPQKTGLLCMNITSDNGVNPNDKNGSSWTTTWVYPQAGGDQPVHAFPNALLTDKAIPIQLSDIKTFQVDISWSYAAGNDPTNITDEASVNQVNLNANVAIDMFLSDDKTHAGNSSLATHEVMIWLGHYGGSTKPVGNLNPVLTTEIINGVQFELYYGLNGQNINVFTWLPSSPTQSYTGDIAPFLTKLSAYPSSPSLQTYLGYVAFGSETFYSTGNVTFSVPRMTMSINGN